MTGSQGPLSVVHLLAPAPFGGLETAVASLAPGLAALGHRVTVGLVLSPDEPDGHPVADALQGTGVSVERLEFPARAYRDERRAVRELLERCEADVLHTHGYRPDVIDAPVARRMGAATVTTVHGYTGGGIRNQLYEWLQKRSLRRFDGVITVSDRLRADLVKSGIDSSRVHSIRNAWEPRTPASSRAEARKALGLPDEAGVVAWVGRMTGEKAPDIMVRVGARVRGDVTFSMIGDGPDRARCQELATELGVADRFRWHGAVPGAGALLSAFDAVVLTSWTEGTPMSVLETMSAAIPLVSTAVGGIPDVVSASEAHLCEPGDIDAIAAAVDDVLEAPQEAARRAASATSRLRSEFAVQPWAVRHSDLYYALIRD